VVAPQLHCFVDFRCSGQALAQRENCLVDHRTQHAVNHEPRAVAHLHRRLADGLRHFINRSIGLVRGLQTSNQFHQRHHWHRVEEVHADHAIRALGRGRELGDRNRRGVAGQQRLRLGDGIELREDLELEIEILGRCLDDEVAVGQGAQIGRHRDFGHRFVFLAGAHLLFLDQTIQAAGNGSQSALQGGVGDIGHYHRVACDGEGLNDSVTHRACANDSNLADAHTCCLLLAVTPRLINSIPLRME